MHCGKHSAVERVKQSWIQFSSDIYELSGTGQIIYT